MGFGILSLQAASGLELGSTRILKYLITLFSLTHDSQHVTCLMQYPNLFLFADQQHRQYMVYLSLSFHFFLIRVDL